MSTPADTPTRATRIRELYEAKARAELAEADRLCPGSDVVAWRGDVLAPVMVVKGMPGPAEAAGGEALSGADGDAVAKALTALGWREGQVFFTLSRPDIALDEGSCASRLRHQIEAVDPRVVLALDEVATADVARSLQLEVLSAGASVLVDGRRVVALTEFEAALGDEKRKRAAWGSLRSARADGPLY